MNAVKANAQRRVLGRSNEYSVNDNNNNNDEDEDDDKFTWTSVTILCCSANIGQPNTPQCLWYLFRVLRYGPTDWQAYKRTSSWIDRRIGRGTTGWVRCVRHLDTFFNDRRYIEFSCYFSSLFSTDLKQHSVFMVFTC